MIDDLNIPENVRQRIAETMDAASIGIPIPYAVKHILTSICFEMYKSGWQDAHRSMDKAIEISEKLFKGI